ncbi:MAG: formate/nitrite transporter family protein [Desulfopila sp.]
MPDTYHPSLTPRELGQHISALGVKKANTKWWQQVVLGLLAGLYIAFGAQIFLVALAAGMSKIVAGALFSVALVLIVLAGAELFTGNVILVVGAISGHFPIIRVVRNWSVVYLANFAGAVSAATLIYLAGLTGAASAPTPTGEAALLVASGKTALSFSEAFIRGIFCNILVILAILMATMAKDAISKIACIVLPIMTFVACGFEHCVANMYLITLGLLTGGVPFVDYTALLANLLPVTLGNIVGGIFILLIHPNRIRQLRMLYLGKRASADSVRDKAS